MMALRKWMAGLLSLAAVTVPAIAKDLFNDGKPMEFTKGAALEAGTTIAGYPIYRGDGGWKLRSVREDTVTNLDGSLSSKLGYVRLDQNEPNGEWFATQVVLVSTRPAGGSTYVNGNPCGGTHIVAVNRAGGKDDNCLIIDAKNFQSGTRMITCFDMVITQTRSGARRYVMELLLSAELLGFRETAPGDWNSTDSLQSSPNRTAFVATLQKWASQLQLGTDHILDYSQPQNVLEGVASYRTLMPIPVDLSDGTYSQSFLGAVVSTKYKPTFRAIAYTKTSSGKTKWSNKYGSDNQEIANRIALENCEKERPPNAEPCKLYDLDKEMATVVPPTADN